MIKKEIVIKNELGLHARPASMFVKEATKFESNITVIKDDTKLNGKSIMNVLGMGAVKGTKIEICAEGPDENAAIETLVALADSNFGE